MTTTRAYLPALPPLMIHHDRVFRHGKIGDNNHVLAVIGADVIHLCVADLLLSSDTNGFNSKLTKGYLSETRSDFVKSPTLARISVLYGLPSQLICMRVNNRDAILASLDAQATVFQAYIGAVYKEYGLMETMSLIKGIFADWLRLKAACGGRVSLSDLEGWSM